MGRTRRTGVAALLHDLDERSPAGCAIGLHIRFSAPRYMFQSYPRRWLERYSASGFAVQDPTIRWGMSNVGSIRWCDLEAIDTQGVLERAKDFGIMNGVTIAIFIDCSRSIASFARSDREYEAGEISDLTRIFEKLHRATENVEALSDGDRAALKDLSIRLTH
jgi:LuxR family transcriptional regulator, quorum-sensing system regulator SdiA